MIVACVLRVWLQRRLAYLPRKRLELSRTYSFIARCHSLRGSGGNAGDSRDSGDIGDSGDSRDSADSRDSGDGRDYGGGRDRGGGRGSGDGRDREEKGDGRDNDGGSKDIRDSRDSRDSKDIRDSRDSRDSRDIRDGRDVRDWQDLALEALRQARRCLSAVADRNHPLIADVHEATGRVGLAWHRPTEAINALHEAIRTREAKFDEWHPQLIGSCRYFACVSHGCCLHVVCMLHPCCVDVACVSHVCMYVACALHLCFMYATHVLRVWWMHLAHMFGMSAAAHLAQHLSCSLTSLARSQRMIVLDASQSTAASVVTTSSAMCYSVSHGIFLDLHFWGQSARASVSR